MKRLALTLLLVLGTQVSQADPIGHDFVISKIKEARSSGETIDLEGELVSWPITIEQLTFDQSAQPNLIAHENGIKIVCEPPLFEPNIEWRFYPGIQTECFGSISDISVEQSRIVIRSYALNRIPQKETIASVPIDIDIRVLNVDLKRVERAIEAFKRGCAPLFSRHATDIDHVTATANPPYGPYPFREFGWGGEIHIAVHLKNQTSTFPEIARANGNVLHYWLGGGLKPGVFMTQEVAEFACGHEILMHNENGAFIHISGLDSLLPSLHKIWRYRKVQ